MDSFKTPLRRKLDSLECHFTWNLSGSKGQRVEGLREYLEEVRKGGGCPWEGHLYNLLGYIVYHITDSAEEALAHLRQAEVALKEREPEGRGPRLLVNQANLAWVHYHLGELPKCHACLEEVTRLQEDFPAPPGCELHPEVYGEKGWTQIKFEHDLKKQAVANFEMALRGDPDRKEWHVGLAFAKYRVYYGVGNGKLSEEIIKQIERAKTMDPDNLRMSALYLVALAAAGQKTEETTREAEKLVQQIKPDQDGLGDLLHFFRVYDSPDRALQIAEESVEKYPSEKVGKKQLAHCYRRKIYESVENIDQELMRKSLDIYEEVISLYPYREDLKMNIAGLYAQSGNIEKADRIYECLLSKSEDLEPKCLQMLYSRYAKHLIWFKNLSVKSIVYHKKVVEIQVHSWERQNSLTILWKIARNNNHPKSEEIQDFLFNHLN
ncbi:interferon-induced protein with tetratricopeptide repeats 2-like [Alosa sapidissima]|uniref:interferon-induced protein with tetratricopeptide repeats 2-like n=1 Tax=Alosa sapidissima TaxID=34773 RepID=UPI001C09739E|nr:interferon-induced protein with tetratricopeptide repeats 2-like [Alosa sapidissima]